MREHLWLAVAMLLLGVGCPSEFGIEGRLDKAMEQDTKEMLEDVKVKRDCPAGKHWVEPKSPCTNLPCPGGCVADPDAGRPSSPP